MRINILNPMTTKTMLIACFTFFAFNLVANLPGQWRNITITSNSIDRNFKVYIPSHFNQVDIKRVVYMFHGTSQNAAKMIEATKWADKAEQEKFIAIFPNSLKYQLLDVDSTAFTSRWNDGLLQLKQSVVPADDVQFFKDMQHWLIQNTGEINKTYICGFSNGAIFASRLLQETPELITAAGLVSSKVPFPRANPIITPVPTMIVFGLKDKRVKEEIESTGGVVPTNYQEFIQCSLIQEVVTFNTSRNQLRVKPTSSNKLQLPDGKQWIYEWPIQPTPFSKHHFEIRLYDKLTHDYPLNNVLPKELNATELFFDFFTNY